MAYSFQTFSIGQILTAAQMNQVEASIRDHVHGTAGVSAVATFVNLTGHVTSVGNAAVLGSFTSAQLLAALTDKTGTGVAVFSTSPVFTTQITTPQIVTASGNLTITPAGNANIVLQGTGTGNVGIGTASPDAAMRLHIASTSMGNILAQNTSTNGANIFLFNDANVLGTKYGTIQTISTVDTFSLGYSSSAGILGTPVLSWNIAGKVGIGTVSPSSLFSVGSTSQFQVGTTGIVAAGTVPLARMMRTEVQGSAAALSMTLNMGTVNEGDRIFITAINTGSSAGTYCQISRNSGSAATIDFAGDNQLLSPAYSGIRATASGICRVTGAGTLIFDIIGTGFVSPNVYAHAIVLNNG